MKTKSIIKVYFSFICFSKYQEAKKLKCEPCYTEDILVLATHFCKTCDDPEPLCETCAKHHTKQRLYRNHQISEDIREFQNIKQKTWYLFFLIRYRKHCCRIDIQWEFQFWCLMLPVCVEMFIEFFFSFKEIFLCCFMSRKVNDVR